MQEITAVKRSTRAYINFARAAFPQEFGQTAQVVLTQVPVIQQARLLKLSTPPIYCSQPTFHRTRYFHSKFSSWQRSVMSRPDTQ